MTVYVDDDYDVVYWWERREPDGEGGFMKFIDREGKETEWRKLTPEDHGVNHSGFESSTLTIKSMEQLNGFQYRAVINNSCPAPKETSPMMFRIPNLQPPVLITNKNATYCHKDSMSVLIAATNASFDKLQLQAWGMDPDLRTTDPEKYAEVLGEMTWYVNGQERFQMDWRPVSYGPCSRQLYPQQGHPHPAGVYAVSIQAGIL